MKKLKTIIKGLLIFIISLIVIISIASGLNNRIGKTTIEASIQGLGTKFVTLTYTSISGKQNFKVGLCINNNLKFKMANDEICFARIQIHKKESFSRANLIHFCVEPKDNIKIKGELKERYITCYALVGSDICNQSLEKRNRLLPYYVNEYDLKIKYRQEFNNTTKTGNLELKERLDSIYKIVIPNIELDFAKKNPDYEMSALILTYDKYISQDTLIKYADSLTDKVKNHYFGKSLFQNINGWKNVKYKRLAPSFSGKTYKGDKFELNELKGKYIILDFWGSWCGSCIKDIPKMKEYYNKYKEKIEIVGISCNDSEFAWKKAIEKNQLEWINILEDKNLNNISDMYSISAFPTKIIIDKEGRIVNKVIGESSVFYQNIDSLMNTK